MAQSSFGHYCLLTYCCTLNVLLPTTVAAIEAAEEDMGIVFGEDEQTVNVATGYAKPIDLAPAVASVITQEDFRRVGARTLEEALDLVPGLQVIKAPGGGSVLNVRGLFSEFGPQILIKRNNIPVSQGSTTPFGIYGLLPIQNIERIEIVRGPTSVLDGPDAFSGVINIITKASARSRGAEVGGRAGSQDASDGWFNYRGTAGPLDVGFSATGWRTDGPPGDVAFDFQSTIDRALGTRASLASGPVNNQNDGVDLELNLSRGPLGLRATYFGLLNAGTGNGTLQALSRDGRTDTHNIGLDLLYDQSLAPNLATSVYFSYLDRESTLSETLLPPGGVPGFPSGLFLHSGISTRFLRGSPWCILESGLTVSE